MQYRSPILKNKPFSEGIWTNILMFDIFGYQSEVINGNRHNQARAVL